MKKIISLFVALLLTSCVVMPAFALKGDSDGDGKITVNDALYALRIAAKLAPETSNDIAMLDTNSDGRITIGDALAILRVAAKLIDSLESNTPHNIMSKYICDNGTQYDNLFWITGNRNGNIEYIISYNTENDAIQMMLYDYSNWIALILNIENGEYSLVQITANSGGEEILYGHIVPSSFSEQSLISYEYYNGDQAILSAYLDMTSAGITMIINWLNEYLVSNNVGIDLSDFGYNLTSQTNPARDALIKHINETGISFANGTAIIDTYSDTTVILFIYYPETDLLALQLGIMVGGSLFAVNLQLETGFYSMEDGTTAKLDGYITPALYTQTSSLQYFDYSGNASDLSYYLDVTQKAINMMLRHFRDYLSYYNVGITISDFGWIAF